MRPASFLSPDNDSKATSQILFKLAVFLGLTYHGMSAQNPGTVPSKGNCSLQSHKITQNTAFNRIEKISILIVLRLPAFMGLRRILCFW